jgi:hypothetical protein
LPAALYSFITPVTALCHPSLPYVITPVTALCHPSLPYVITPVTALCYNAHHCPSHTRHCSVSHPSLLCVTPVTALCHTRHCPSHTRHCSVSHPSLLFVTRHCSVSPVTALCHTRHCSVSHPSLLFVTRHCSVSLQGSLGGNSLTAMVGTVALDPACADDSLSTLQVGTYSSSY